MRRFTLPIASASVVALFAATAFAGPPPPPPSEGVEGGGSRPTSAGVRPAPPPPPSTAGMQRTADPLVDQRTPTEDLSRTWGYSSGGEAKPNYVRPAQETGLDIQINPIGYYQGVTIEGENLPPFAPAQVGGPAVMTWTGFEGERGSTGSHVFLQLSAPVDHHMVQQPELLTLRLPNTSVNVKNNMRRLDTSYFRTPVTSVDITRDGADTVVKVGLRRAVNPNVFMREGANGYKILVIEFPVQSDLAGTEEAVAPPPPPAAPES